MERQQTDITKWKQNSLGLEPRQQALHESVQLNINLYGNKISDAGAFQQKRIRKRKNWVPLGGGGRRFSTSTPSNVRVAINFRENYIPLICREINLLTVVGKSSAVIITRIEPFPDVTALPSRDKNDAITARSTTIKEYRNYIIIKVTALYLLLSTISLHWLLSI